MAARNPDVDAYFRELERWKPELTALRRIVLACDVTEQLKWKRPCYTHGGGNVAILGAMKASAVLGFNNGALLRDPAGILVAPGENSQYMRMVHFTSVERVTELEDTLQEYIGRAIANEAAGRKVDPRDRPEIALPLELEAKFAELPELKAAFEALTPGRQRGYLLHFTAAKQPKTREARIDRCVPRILEGFGLNDRA